MQELKHRKQHSEQFAGLTGEIRDPGITVPG